MLSCPGTINRGCQPKKPAGLEASIAGSGPDRSAIPDTYLTRCTRSVLVQIRNPNAQSGIATQAREESRDGFIIGVTAFAAGFGTTHAIAQKSMEQAKFGFPILAKLCLTPRRVVSPIPAHDGSRREFRAPRNEGCW